MRHIKEYTHILNEAAGQEDLNRAFMDAVMRKDLRDVKDLLDRGADVDYIFLEFSALAYAARTGDLGTLEILLDHGADPNVRNKDGMTALSWAVDNFNIDVARLLLDRGADPNARQDDGSVPLHWAAAFGRTDLAKLLIDTGADPNARNKRGSTPLNWAALYGRTEVAKILILLGADPLGGFESLQGILDFFKGDIDWMPESDLKRKLKLAKRSKKMFGM